MSRLWYVVAASSICRFRNRKCKPARIDVAKDIPESNGMVVMLRLIC